MPYSSRSELPDAVKKLPAHGQDIYMKAFNAAFALYDGDEGKAAGTAWAAVKTQYEQNAEGLWVAKEAIMVTKTKLSDKNMRAILQTALMTEYSLGADDPIPKKLAVVEVFDEKLIYDIDGQLYEAGYEMDEKGKPQLGEPFRVTTMYKAMEALSMENKKSILEAALIAQLNIPEDEYLYIEDMTESEVFYNHGRQTYKVNYTIAESDGAVTFGEPVKVTRLVTYKPIESLQAVYSEIVQEAGKRNAILDAARVKKIVELCQELLSSEEPEEKKTNEALKEATAVLAWLKKQEEPGAVEPQPGYGFGFQLEASALGELGAESYPGTARAGCCIA